MLKDKINTIICGDCLEVMKDWPDNCVDLIITSPPYGDLRKYKGYVFDFENIGKQLYRITKKGGVVVWVVGDALVNHSESGDSFRQALYFKSIGYNLHDTMIYQKAGISVPAVGRYHQVFEYMFVLSKGRPKTFNSILDRKNRWCQPWGKASFRNKDGSKTERLERKRRDFGMRWNIWRYVVGFGNSTTEEIASEHPAIFPEQLATDHIISWSNECDLVLDPMNGSGTTTKMAAKLKRNYIGIDISEKYCEIARKRLEAVDTGVPVKEQKKGQMALFNRAAAETKNENSQKVSNIVPH